MTKISIKVNGAAITATANGKITTGMVGVPVDIEYGDGWEGLSKVVVFRCDGIARDRRTNELSTTVPWEVLRRPGKILQVGIEGRNEDGSIVIPTIWADVATVQQGATPNIPGTPHPDDPGYDYNNSVLYVKQTLTAEQMEQARSNIGALSEEEMIAYVEESILGGAW